MEALAQVEGWPARRAAVAVTRADAELGSVGPRDEAFDWASVTKPLTALAALVAVEEGTIELEQPAGPEGSTVRHLLSHASGLPLDAGGPTGRPGHRRIYSNVGFEVLADTIAAAAGMSFAEYLGAAVLEPLGFSGTLEGSPASGYRGTLDDLAGLGRELLAPRLIAPETLEEATTTAFPGLVGVLPGFGRMEPNDWGLGLELRDAKSPHWTGRQNSPRTFGHFGRSGTFLWVDPEPGLACACLTDLPFGDWAKEAWPRLSDAVLTQAEGRRGEPGVPRA
ncbi:MAG TPA: serine hydrolase domain-containing protein [Gaiellaceae bacterium]